MRWVVQAVALQCVPVVAPLRSAVPLPARLSHTLQSSTQASHGPHSITYGPAAAHPVCCCTSLWAACCSKTCQRAALGRRTLSSTVLLDRRAAAVLLLPPSHSCQLPAACCAVKKSNQCVACGELGHYLRYRVVPSCYRRAMPVRLKSHRRCAGDEAVRCAMCCIECCTLSCPHSWTCLTTALPHDSHLASPPRAPCSHDIVLLCVSCHELAHAVRAAHLPLLAAATLAIVESIRRLTCLWLFLAFSLPLLFSKSQQLGPASSLPPICAGRREAEAPAV